MRFFQIFLLFSFAFCISRRYMNYEKLLEAGSPKNPIDVLCYDRGLYYVCPNPENEKLVSEMERQLDFGLYINKIEFRITRENLRDPAFFNL